MNEFIFNNLKKPSKKQPQLAQNIQNFYTTYSAYLFPTILRELTYTLFFEDHKNVWIFQKCVHSTIVMCEGGAEQGVEKSFKTIMEIVNKNEI